MPVHELWQLEAIAIITGAGSWICGLQCTDHDPKNQITIPNGVCILGVCTISFLHPFCGIFDEMSQKMS